MAVTTTYLWPVAGLTAPTAIQAFGHNQVSADIAKSADGDATVTITHNMNISVADLASGFPEVSLEPTLAKYYTTAPFVASRTTNAVVITLGTGGGSGDAAVQIRARIRRPMSLAK